MKTLDQIHIKDLLVRGIIGINDWERKAEQDIVINVTLFCQTQDVAGRDEVNENFNYRTIAKEIIAHTKESKRFTVESLAADIAKLCLAKEGLDKVRVSVEKPGALRFARSVGVEIERESADCA